MIILVLQTKIKNKGYARLEELTQRFTARAEDSHAAPDKKMGTSIP